MHLLSCCPSEQKFLCVLELHLNRVLWLVEVPGSAYFSTLL